MKITFVILWLLANGCLSAFVLPVLRNKFGPGKINLKSISYCKDYKGKKPTSYEFGTVKNSFTGLTDILTVNYTLFHDAGPVQVQYKISDWNRAKNRFGHPITLDGGTVCYCTMCKESFEHFADFKEPFKACIAKKGNKFVKANLTQLAYQWFGRNSFYRTIKNEAKLFTPKEILYVVLL